MARTLMRCGDAYSEVYRGLEPTKEIPHPHSLAYATRPDGTTEIYCQACDQTTPTHCCPDTIGWWGEEICPECAAQDWWLDLLQRRTEDWDEERWER